MDYKRAGTFIDEQWESKVIPSLSEYIKIPALSPEYDADWETNGNLMKAAEHMVAWVESQNLKNASVEIISLPGKTPVILIEVPGNVEETVLLYGHLDKQPPMDGWSEGLGPWTPVRRNNHLYGRGSVDDGYAVYAAVTAIKALQEQDLPHARCAILIEASEESGSIDLPAYLEHLKDRLRPHLVISLDAGGKDFERVWIDTSLRGLIVFDLSVRVLNHGAHQGLAGGLLPSSFRILRTLLDRIEDHKTGEILLPELNVEIPKYRIAEAADTAQILTPDMLYDDLHPLKSTRPVHKDLTEALLANTWKPSLEVVGAGGMPPKSEASTVLRPYTSLRLAMRTPPTLDTKKAYEALKKTLTEDPPYDAEVTVQRVADFVGWNAPETESWLVKASQDACQTVFGQGDEYIGAGGSIPFVAAIGEAFPGVQCLTTGVLGPHSNLHGPDESINIAFAKKFNTWLSAILYAHYEHTKQS